MGELTGKVENGKRDFSYYADALRRAGYKNVMPLLYKDIEAPFLGSLESGLKETLQSLIPPSSPEITPQGVILPREVNQAKRIREEVEQKMKSEAINDLVETIRVIPPENLFGLCAVHHQSLVLTDIGNAIVSLKDRWRNLHLFLYHGRARESAGTKPRRLIREPLPAKSYRIPWLSDMLRRRDELALTSPGESIDFQFPDSDFDFLACSSTGEPSLEEIANLFQAGVFRRGKGGWAEERQSTRRTGFRRVEFGVSGYLLWNQIRDQVRKVGRTSLGHLFYPALDGIYDPSNLLVPFLMESARVDIPILLVPFHHLHEDKTIIWGLAVDFWGGFQDVSRHRLTKQKWLGNSYSIALYPFPEMTFPKDFPQQSLFNLGYALRTWPWGAKQPVMRPQASLTPSLTHEQLEDVPFIKRRLSKETQDFMSQEVVTHLNNLAKSDIDSFGSVGQRVEAGLSLLEDIAQALDGDSVATILRLLPAGLSYTEKRLDLFGTNIYGFGIIDENGLFSELGRRFAEDRDILERLKKRVMIEAELRILELSLRSVMKLKDTEMYQRSAAIVDGRIESLSNRIEKLKSKVGQQEGRRLFFNLLFEIAGGDNAEALKLLRPIWCKENEWKEVQKKYAARLVALDDRFGRIKTTPLSQIILELITGKDGPVSAPEIAESLNKPQTQIFRALQSLEREGSVVRLGGHRAKRGSGPRGIGVGGSRAFFCLPDQAERFQAELTYLTPQERLLAVMRQDHQPKTFRQLATLCGLNESTVSAAMKILRDEGSVQTDGRLWSLNPQEGTTIPVFRSDAADSGN